MKQQEHPTTEQPGVRPRSRWRKPIKILLILGAIFGALVIGIVSWALNALLHRTERSTSR